jgi:hypothetical protein
MPRMRKSPVFLAIAAVAVCAGAFAQQKPDSGRQTYKWVDEKGVTHYGDSVPSQYSQREQRVLNEQGLEVKRHAAELSPEKQAELAQIQKAEADRKRHDVFLISTYPSVKEIENVRDNRLGQIGGQISAAEAYIQSLTQRVTGLKQRAMLFQPYNTKPGARRMPDDLAEELVRALSELRTQDSALVAKRAEHQAVVDQFAGDIKRFKELRMSAQSRMNDNAGVKR